MNPTRPLPSLAPSQSIRSAAVRCAFTLVELLVVMAIIAIVIALVVPALFGGRNAARKAAAFEQITRITNAAAAFTNDERRAPGYFPARMMGRSENLARGISGAENLMLDLAGFQSGADWVGPTGNQQEQLAIDPQMMGVPGQGSKQYYVPDKKLYVAQIEGTQQVGAPPHAGAEGIVNQLPDVVDPWGTPLLVWTQDETYMIKPNVSNSQYRFARVDSGNGSLGAKFYWAQNACFLSATQSGKRSLDQASGSMMGLNASVGDRETSMTGAFGSPNAPFRDPSALNDVPTIPLSGRAPIIVQSAGSDGFYFGKKDRGARQFPGNAILYGMNFAPNPGQISPTNQYTDKNGKATNIDVLADFDDLFSYGGN